MNIIYFLDPESDFLRANTLIQWCTWLKIINKSLKTNNNNIKSLFLGYQSSKNYFDNSFEVFHGLSMRETRDLMDERNNYRLYGPDSVNIMKVRHALALYNKPDVIISIGDAKFLECIFPEVKIFHVEMSPFYRLMNSGLRFCVTISDWAKLSDVVLNIPYLDDCILTAEVSEALDIIKSDIRDKNKNSELNLKIESYKKQYKKICLIPLAETKFSPMKVKLFSLISDFMEKSDEKELYILADHPLAMAVSDSELSLLKNKHSNIICVRNDFGCYATSNFYDFCDVVYTDFSNASVDSLFFNNIEYRSLLAGLDVELERFVNFRNSLSSYMVSLDRANLDKILYLLLKYYTISPSKFFDGLWWGNLLSTSDTAATLADIEKKLG